MSATLWAVLAIAIPLTITLSVFIPAELQYRRRRNREGQKASSNGDSEAQRGRDGAAGEDGDQNDELSSGCQNDADGREDGRGPVPVVDADATEECSDHQRRNYLGEHCCCLHRHLVTVSP